MKKQLSSWFLSIAFLGICGCDKAEQAPPPPPTPAVTTAPAAAAPAVDPNRKPDVELKIGSRGEEMAYDKAELSAKAGALVKLTFVNHSRTSGLQHNWVLVQPGKEDEVVQAGVIAGDAKGWVPESPSVIAHTSLVRDADGSASVTFVAPPAGNYTYLCTFPGHYPVMKGVFKSTP